MVKGNERVVQQVDALNMKKDSPNNVDSFLAINQSDELQSLTIENESGTSVGNLREAIKVAISTKNIGNFVAHFLNFHPWVREKLKSL